MSRSRDRFGIAAGIWGGVVVGVLVSIWAGVGPMSWSSRQWWSFAENEPSNTSADDANFATCHHLRPARRPLPATTAADDTNFFAGLLDEVCPMRVWIARYRRELSPFRPKKTMLACFAGSASAMIQMWVAGNVPRRAEGRVEIGGTGSPRRGLLGKEVIRELLR